MRWFSPTDSAGAFSLGPLAADSPLDVHASASPGQPYAASPIVKATGSDDSLVLRMRNGGSLALDLAGVALEKNSGLSVTLIPSNGEKPWPNFSIRGVTGTVHIPTLLPAGSYTALCAWEDQIGYVPNIPVTTGEVSSVVLSMRTGAWLETGPSDGSRLHLQVYGETGDVLISESVADLPLRRLVPAEEIRIQLRRSPGQAQDLLSESVRLTAGQTFLLHLPSPSTEGAGDPFD